MAQLLRDLTTYIRRLARWRSFAGLPGVAGLVLAVISAVQHHAIGIVAWAWLAIGLGGVVIAGFVEWRSIIRRPMPPEHADELREIADRLDQGLWNWKTVSYVIPGRTERPLVKRMFRSHFPAIVVLCDRLEDYWSSATRQREDLKVAVIQSATEAFPQSDGWHPDGIASNAMRVLTEGTMASDEFPTLELSSSERAVTWNAEVVKSLVVIEDGPISIQAIRDWINVVWQSTEARAIKTRIHDAQTLIERTSDLLDGVVHNYSDLPGSCELCSSVRSLKTLRTKTDQEPLERASE